MTFGTAIVLGALVASALVLALVLALELRARFAIRAACRAAEQLGACACCLREFDRSLGLGLRIVVGFATLIAPRETQEAFATVLLGAVAEKGRHEDRRQEEGER